MTLYEYITPILKKYPDKKCIIYDDMAIGFNAIHTGKIGDILSRYLVYTVNKVMLGDKYMHFWDDIGDETQETEDILRIWVSNTKNINSELGILGGV